MFYVGVTSAVDEGKMFFTWTSAQDLTLLLMHSPGETVCSWLGQVQCLLDIKLSEWVMPKRGVKWS